MSSEDLLKDWLRELEELKVEFQKIENMEEMEWWKTRAETAREEIENLREFISQKAA